MKKVLVISASLREGGNSDVLADRFVQGAKDAGNEVEKISLIGKNIGFCRGCLACQKTMRCVMHDDAEAIIAKMKDADVIAFATPIYYYGMAGQLKTLLDRSNPLFPSDYAFREIYLLAAGAEVEKDLSDSTEDGLMGWIVCFDECDLAGTVCAQGVTDVGDVLKDEKVLKLAYDTGRKV